MVQRFCPNCNSKLGSHDRFFCTGCGTELPDELSKSGDNVMRVLNIEEPQKEELDPVGHLIPVLKNVLHILNFKEVLLIVFLGIIIGVPVYLWLNNFTSLVNEMAPPAAEPQVVEKSGIVVDISEEYEEHIFGANMITDYVPYSVDVYIEGHDFPKMSKVFEQFDPGYEPVFAILTPVVDSHFGAYLIKDGDDYVWTMILFPFDDLLEENEIDLEEQLDQFEWLSSDRVEDVLILSTVSNKVQIEEAKSKLSKNLTLNPIYAKYKSESPKSGKIQFITFTLDGKQYVNMLSRMDFPQEIESVLDNYLEADTENVVFK